METATTEPGTAALTRYQRDGFLSPISLLDAEKVGRYRTAFDTLEREEGRDKCVIQLKGRHTDQLFVRELATHPRVLDWIESLVGPDLMLMSTHFFCKYPGDDAGHFVAWHQDVTYWGLEPAEAITAWIAIDTSDRANGCMEVIPGSHRQGLYEHGTSTRPNNLLATNQAIAERHLALESVVPLELQAGQMSIHHGALAHASRPNTSGRRRCGLTARFITPEVRQVRANNSGLWWQPELVRGKDRFNHWEHSPN